MGGENLTSPQLDEETLVTVADERLDTPETPELPPALDIKLDTLLESTGLEDTSGLDFAISKSLEEALESGHDATALISVVEQIDPQQVVELLADIDDPSAVPDRVTMSNLLSGDPNSPAAQFILENLAKQCADGAFITLQSTSRGNAQDAHSAAKRRAETLATTMALLDVNGITQILNTGFSSYDNANTTAERLDALLQSAANINQAWLENNPDATPEQKEFMHELSIELAALDIYQKYAEQLENGTMSLADFQAKTDAVRAQLEELGATDALEKINALEENADNLTIAQEALASAQEALAQGQHNAHVVTHYQGVVADLKTEQQLLVDQLIQLRDDALQNYDTAQNLSLDELNELIAREQAELQQLTDLEAQLLAEINGLTEETKQVGAELQQIDADISTSVR